MTFNKDLYQKYETGGMKETHGKLDYTLLPWIVLDNVVRIMEYGAVKYGRFNWKNVPRIEYIKAGLRHITAYLKGETVDKESGFNHLDHACCNMLYAAFPRNEKQEVVDE